MYNVQFYPSRDAIEIIVGTSQEISINIVVRNNGEDAFLSILDIQELEGLYFVQIDKLSSVSTWYVVINVLIVTCITMLNFSQIACNSRKLRSYS